MIIESNDRRCGSSAGGRRTNFKQILTVFIDYTVGLTAVGLLLTK